VNRVDSPPIQECKSCKVVCNLQSETVETILDGTEVGESTSTTVVEFLDETPGSSWGIENPVRSNLVDQQPEIELAKYLSRPVLIKTHTWAQTDNFTTTTAWYPWHLFFNSTPIKNKIQNYSFISCTLKLKFVVNASPFYSGAMAFTYCPLQDINGNSIIADSTGSELMAYSQRAKCWIFPQTCQGGELTLPFFYHKNWLDLTSAAALRSMGTITPCLYAQLNSANGITGTSIVINVYAWAEDIKLHAPTLSAAVQSDEFDYKPSQVASSVATAASALQRIPLIGPYMKATSAVASKFSQFASVCGFTNVPNNKTVDMFKPNPYPQNSSCDISVPIERSSVDPKNEVTIDPRTVGLDGTDELDLSYIAGRECWLGNAILSTSDAVDALTLVSRVTPALMYQLNATNPRQYTPMGYLCEMFKHWRGDIIFRFKFICTRFHKGRVRISYDPTADISTSVPDYTTIFNEVIDIGAEQDVEVRVPYMQATTYLRTAMATGNWNFTGSALAPAPGVANGLITMRVVNPLSGPIATAGIYVMVFARAAENIEYAYPTLLTTGTTALSPYALQSAELIYPLEPKKVIAGNSVTDGDPNRNHIHYGERILSLRPLIHRLTHQFSKQAATVAAGDQLTIQNTTMSRRLKYSGYDPNAFWTAQKTLVVGTAPYNYNKMNVQQLASLLFVGQRGSINWSFNCENVPAREITNLTLKRYDGTVTNASLTTAVTTTSTSGNVLTQVYSQSYNDFNNGVALTDQRNQPGIAMNFPYYSQYNFQLVNPANASLGSGNDGTDLDNIQLQAVVQQQSAFTPKMSVWAALGPDYNFFYFNNTPSLYAYTVPAGT